jgi:hypothetical protein
MKLVKGLALSFSLVKASLLFSIAVCSANVWSQESENRGVSIDAELSLLRDTNVQRNVTQIADNLVRFAPQMSFSSSIGKHYFNSAYSGVYTKHSSLSHFDYNNHIADFSILLDHSAKLSTKFGANYEDAVEAPGSTNGVLTDTSGFNQFTTRQVSAELLYGTQNSKGQISVAVSRGSINYTSNEQAFRNSDTTSITGGYFYRIAPATRLIIEVESLNFDYDDVDSIDDQSSQQNTYSTGIEWATSAQTTSVFRLGYQSVDYESPVFVSSNNLYYSLDFIWQPKIYTQLTLGATREATQSAIQGTAGIIRKTYSIDLQHQLSNLIVLDSVIEYSEDDILIRTDTNTNFQLGLTYSAKHWLDISLSYILEERESDDSLFDYDSELIQISFISTFY